MIADKENRNTSCMAAAAPACSLIQHIGKRESFLAGAGNANNIAPLTSCKGAASALNSRFRSNKDLRGMMPPRSQPFVPNKAKGLLSSKQMQALITRRNIGSRQRTDIMNAQIKGSMLNATFMDTMGKSYRTAVQSTNVPSRKTNHVRQFKSLTNVETD